MPDFKRIGGAIFGVQFSKKEEKALLAEINRQIYENQKEFFVNYDCMVLWTLHTVFGFGEGRLRKFYKEFTKQHLELAAYYQCDGDSGRLCKHKLKGIGIDVSQWAKDLEHELNSENK